MNLCKYRASALLVATLCGVPHTASMAQPADSGVRWDFSGSVIHQPNVDIDGGGEFSLSAVYLRAGVSRSIAPRHALGLTLSYNGDDYDFSDTAELGGQKPWNDVRRFGLAVPLTSRLGEDLVLGLSPSVNWLQETDARASDSVSYGLTGFLAKSFSRTRSIGLGAGVFRTIDDEVDAFPFLAIDWAFNDRWRLANPFDADALGPAGLELSYRINDRWQLGGGSVYRSFRFRLDEQGVAPGGVGENSSAVVFLRLRRQSEFGLGLDLYAGAAVAGSLELDDRDGDRLADSDYDTAPFAALTVTFEL